MTRPRSLLLTLASLLLAALPVLAQSSVGVPAPRSTAPGSTAPGSTRGRQQPCWQVAGISQQTLQQRRQIEENTRSQVQSVCANSSISPEQKREQIRQIHEQARKQIEGLISPQQEEALKSCRQQRGGEHEGHGGGMHHGGGEGPCGDMPTAGGHPNAPKPTQSQSEPEQQ